MSPALEKARILIEALPYITRFHHQIVVIKYGGSAMVDPQLTEAIAQDIALLKFVGLKPVVVHGGGKDITAWLNKVGKEAKFIDGLRVTDAETMELTEMVLIGKVKKAIMHGITKFGGKCVGLSGKDAQLIEAKQRSDKLGLVGDITKINAELLHTLIAQDYVPVISPIGVGHDGTTYNINADHTASAVAGALRAAKFILLTDVQGVLDKNKKLIQRIAISDISQLLTSAVVAGGMIPKLECAREAIKQGVASAHILDGRLEHALLLEIFTDQGIGTMVLPD